ncbi:MAG TPA: multicopper oxidase domain-containing protein [Vicinamibacterales bacterium]|nr:multicopper oxidase domain-containing protein [Vicinamibacterales bacterium]
MMTVRPTRVFAATACCALFAWQAAAQPPVPPVANPCQRPSAGSIVQNPPALVSFAGFLTVRLSYQHAFDDAGRELLCFMTQDGLENPTLHVQPGDRLMITITNNLPAGSAPMVLNAPNCGAPIMNSTSVNIHYHGTNTSPTCHQDEVIKTIINAGQTFQYDVQFPINEPPGLYWYHPHVHGISEHAVQGGASGAIVVDGIENVQPAAGGLRQRILIVRDQAVPGNPNPAGNVPSWDVTLNHVPITSPTHPSDSNFVPAILQMQTGDRELWRICNASSDTVLDVQYMFDAAAQPMQVVAMDGVPVNSQDGAQPGTPVSATHVLLPPASRVELIVSAPPSTVGLAQLVTQAIDTGPDGDNDPQRPLATIQTVNVLPPDRDGSVPRFAALKRNARRFAGLAEAPIAASRTVYFDENNATSTFFMVVDGKPEHVFDPNAAPDIVATQGTVEEWTVQNRTQEVHEFHFHQLHFLVESQNNFEVNGSPQAPIVSGQYLDMIQVPYWDGDPTHPFPSVTLRIDFRGSDVGDFVFHCHILEHEDGGMMNIVRVQNPGNLRVQRADRPKSAKAKPAAAVGSH